MAQFTFQVAEKYRTLYSEKRDLYSSLGIARVVK
jgi:hypothetical protein